MDPESDLPVRRTGKVLLVNENRELLLFRANERLPDGTARQIWFPVGGGAEGDETFAECAVRELCEETGLRVAVEDLGDVVGVRAGGFVLDGVPTWSDEAFFFFTIPQWEVDDAGFTELERQQLIAHRWWPLTELANTDRTVFPSARELAALIATILTFGPPAEPAVLAWENPPGWPQINTKPQQEP